MSNYSINILNDIIFISNLKRCMYVVITFYTIIHYNIIKILLNTVEMPILNTQELHHSFWNRLKWNLNKP